MLREIRAIAITPGAHATHVRVSGVLLFVRVPRRFEHILLRTMSASVRWQCRACLSKWKKRSKWSWKFDRVGARAHWKLMSLDIWILEPLRAPPREPNGADSSQISPAKIHISGLRRWKSTNIKKTRALSTKRGMYVELTTSFHCELTNSMIIDAFQEHRTCTMAEWRAYDVRPSVFVFDKTRVCV